MSGKLKVILAMQIVKHGCDLFGPRTAKSALSQ